MADLIEVMGCEPNEFSDRIYHHRPDWVQGMISHWDARYLLGRALATPAARIVEIGTASGVSTVFLCQALGVRSRSGAIDGDFEVISYDLSPQFYADPTRATGDATRAMLPDDLLPHVRFRSPAMATTVADEFDEDEISFMFIDANHRHPWPALDLLSTLDALQPGAEVVLHDINLPVRRSEAPDWGVKYVFDELDVEKAADSNDPNMPNIGSIWVPADKEDLRRQLLEIVSAHEWQVEVPEEVTARALP